MQENLNLLMALDALIREGSVTVAARRMGLSVPAMSHALARIRKAMNDPILVRAGRGLVPSQRAEAVRGRVSTLVREATEILRPDAVPDLRTLNQVFNIRVNDALAGVLALACCKPCGKRRRA